MTNEQAIQDYEKIQRHIGRKIKHAFKNADGTEDTFEFVPASVEIYSKFTALFKYKDDIDGIKITPESLSILMDILKTVVKSSYPSWPDELCESFITQNLEEMSQVLLKILPTQNIDKNKIITIQNSI